MAANGDGWKVAAIDDIPPVKPDWPATWKSMRHHFGITAFGVNAVTKDAGNVLIPEHGHAETGEQELYIIQRGAAVATLDGEQVDVPAGSAVARVESIEKVLTFLRDLIPNARSVVFIVNPAGSAVAVEGPVRRKFEATESPTTLIVVGGTPGKPYEVGDWER